MSTSPFGRTASNKEGGDWELPPTGLQAGVLIALVDLGTHGFTFKDKKTGQEKTSESRSLYFAWELTEEKQKDGKPFVVGVGLADKLTKTSDYRKLVEGWIGRALADQEEFDPATMLMKPCLLNLSEGLSAKNQKFVEIMGVAQPMRGQVFTKPTLKTFTFHLCQLTCQKEELNIPDWMPRNFGRVLADDIRSSKEWKALPVVSPEYAIDNPITEPANGQPAGTETMSKFSSY